MRGCLKKYSSGLKIIIALTLFSVTGVSGLFSDGYQFPGIGARELARGGAVTADVSNWTSIYWNPAGLSEIRGKWNGGFHLLYAMTDMVDDNSVPNSFSAIDPTLPAAYDKTSNEENSFLGSVGAAYRINNRYSVAVGLYAPLLNGVEFSDSLRGPASQSSVRLDNKVTLLYPSVSFAAKINDRLSVGAGISTIIADMELDVKETYTSPLLPVRMISHSDLDASGFGVEGNIGLQFKIHPKLLFGMMYRTGSYITMKGSGTQKLTNPLTFTDTIIESDFTSDFVVPPTLAMGLCLVPEDRLRISFDIQRTFWNNFDNHIDFDNPLVADIPNTADWKDANRYRLGINWLAPKEIDVNAGLFYYEHAVDAPDLLLVIDADQLMWTAGLGRDFKRVRVDASVVQGGGGDTLDGNYRYIKGLQFNLGLELNY